MVLITEAPKHLDHKCRNHNILPVRHGTFNILLPHSQQELEPNLVVIKDYIVLEKDKTTSLCQRTELERKICCTSACFKMMTYKLKFRVQLPSANNLLIMLPQALVGKFVYARM